MDKKIIALDLDGTLLNSDGIVTEATKKHLKKLKELVLNNIEIQKKKQLKNFFYLNKTKLVCIFLLQTSFYLYLHFYELCCF